MEIHVCFIGVLLVLLALLHIGFPRYFNWEQELKTLSLINRQMLIIRCFFIAMVLLLMGILCISSATELTQTSIGRKICLGFAIFWTLRLLIQFFGYSALLWKGKKRETFVHFLFAFLWTYFSAVFWLVYFKN